MAMVCDECGLTIAWSNALEKYVHTEEPPEGWEGHDARAVDVAERIEREKAAAVEAARAEPKSLQQRQTEALERIAAALEKRNGDG